MTAGPWQLARERPLAAVSRVVPWLRAVVVFRRYRVAHGRAPMLLGRRPLINARGKIEVGERFRILGRQFPVQLSVAEHASLTIGDDVFLNQGANVYAGRSIVIGDHVMIGDLVAIYDTNFHEIEQGAGILVEPVTIESNVWLGRGAVVLPGVTIGRNSVVGAGAVVASSVPPDSVAAGNPARVVGAVAASAGYVRR